MFGDLFDCGCSSRKEVIGAADWQADLAILLVLGIAGAAVFLGLKELKEPV